MERKKRFRRATKESAQIKRIGAEELAQEFPDGAYNAPPIRRVIVTDRKSVV